MQCSSTSGLSEQGGLGGAWSFQSLAAGNCIILSGGFSARQTDLGFLPLPSKPVWLKNDHLTGLVKWILYWPAFIWRFFWRKKSADCLLKKSSWWKKIICVQYYLCASENAYFVFRRHPAILIKWIQVSIRYTQPMRWYLPLFWPFRQLRAAVEHNLSLSQTTPISWYTYCYT